MGYTHYWNKNQQMDKKQWDRFTEIVGKLLADPDVAPIIAWEHDQPNKPPEVSKEFVRFNGKDDDGHETFYFDRIATRVGAADNDGKCFDFCKTARKSYDKAVVACLVLAKLIFQEDIRVSSDGDLNDWQEGKALAQKYLGSELDFTYDEVNRGFMVRAKIMSVEEFLQSI
jgi:hypothetical protein